MKGRKYSTVTRNYSLWLMPSGQAYRRLRGIILKLGGQYSTPIFKPHVTLLGRIVAPRREVLEKSARLARGMRPLVIRLGSLDGLDEHYRCLFVRAAKTRPLRDAYRAACQIFSVKKRPAYMPHLSLIYGDLPPRLKEQIIRRLGGRLALEFEVRSLRLYSTTGKPRAWRQIEAFDLSGVKLDGR